MDENTKHDKQSFLDHRKLQEDKHFNGISSKDFSPLHSILTVEINTTELCNRTCVFCPRHDPKVFPNRNLHMTTKGAEHIAKELGKNEYKGKISFSGFGENFLNPEFDKIIFRFRLWLPDATIECNTNGDKLTTEYAKSLFDSGLDLLYINLYDGIEQIEHFNKIMRPFPTSLYKYRAHYNEEDYGLFLNNRSGTIDWIGIEDSDVESLKGKPCYYPFYKMFVDWNGDVLFCSNDWGREHIIGNLQQQTLEEVWFSKPMKKIRAKLSKGNRSHSPCNKCSVDGTLFGKRSFNIINEMT
jgi:radical SAM protein with 4Fe4S-binding SPASM domain